MSNPVFNFFGKLAQVRLSRIVIPVLASFVLLLSTACGTPTTKISGVDSSRGGPPGPSLTGTGSYQKGRQPETELYRPIQPNEGGMNSYSDTDPRRNTKGLSSEVKTRVNEADRNIKKVNTPGEFADDYRSGTPLGERVRNITDSVGDAAKDVSDDVAAGTQRGMRNLKANTQNAVEGTQNTVDNARGNAAAATKDATRTAKRTADELGNNFDNARRDIRDNIQGS